MVKLKLLFLLFNDPVYNFGYYYKRGKECLYFGSNTVENRQRWIIYVSLKTLLGRIETSVSIIFI